MEIVLLFLLFMWFFYGKREQQGHKVKLTKEQTAAFERLRKRCYPY